MKQLYISFLFTLLTGTAWAQSPKVSARIDSSKILIGDQVLLKLEVEHEAKQAIKFPFLKDSIGKIEILSRSGIDTILQSNSYIIKERQSYKITAYDTGFYAIPSLTFTYKKMGDTTTYTVTTEPIKLSVFQPKVDTTLAIKDIKDPLKVPLSFWEILPYLLIFIVLPAVIGGIIYYIRKKRKGESIFAPVIPAKPAHEQALEALQALETEKHWQQGALKEYHSQLTDIIRVYIEQRYKLPAMEQTSDETLQSLRTVGISEEQYLQLIQILKLADMVKFAKGHPLANDNELSLQNAYFFVNSTMPIQETINHQETTNNSNV